MLPPAGSVYYAVDGEFMTRLHTASGKGKS